MAVPRQTRFAALLVVVLTAALAVAVGYSTGPAYAQMNSSQYSVSIATKPGLGSYLTNSTGFSLYTFWHDIPSNGTSKCTDKCLEAWPAFYVATLTLPPGLSASSFIIITRPDGSKQLAYDGWLLYYFFNDTKPGDTNGQGAEQLWSVCTIPTPFSLFATSTVTASASTTTKGSGGGW